jgi:Domain of unknown function (DUF5666)
MNPLLRRSAALLVLLLAACSVRAPAPVPPAPRAAAACSAASPLNPAVQIPGIGGTGAVASMDPGGIGGTGQVAHEGTGMGGTGIVGVVTGFASVCVNGVEVEVEADTPVRRDGQGASLVELAVGQLVAVRAQGTGTEVRALRIEMLDAVVGPVEVIDTDRQVLRVLGQRVRVLAVADLAPLKPGDWVRVSGHRLATGEVRASRVQLLAPGAPRVAQALGVLEPDGVGGWRLGGTPIPWPPGQASPADGQEWLVQGTWDGQRLQPQRLVPQPTRRALGEARDVVLQGYVHGLSGRELQLGYEVVQLEAGLVVRGGALASVRVGQPVQVRGRLDAQNRVLATELSLGREGGRGARSGGESGDDSGGRRGRNRGGDGESGSDSSGSGSSGSDSSGSGSSGSGSSGSGSSGSSGSGQGRGRGGRN